jgi:hypothetical protein
VERKLKFPSNQMEADLYIAGNVSKNVNQKDSSEKQK